MTKESSGTRSIHRVIAQELSTEELQQIAGGTSYYTTYDEPGDYRGHTDTDVGGTWSWSF
jgi:bacteriocin-like protein